VITRRAASPLLFGLAPGGVYPASDVTAGAVRSYRTFSPLPFCGFCRKVGRVFSVALSVGSLPVRVTDHPALWCSDFPLRRQNQRSDHPVSFGRYNYTAYPPTCQTKFCVLVYYGLLVFNFFKSAFICFNLRPKSYPFDPSRSVAAFYPFIRLIRPDPWPNLIRVNLRLVFVTALPRCGLNRFHLPDQYPTTVPTNL
jgi:hypothetical protein